MYSVGTHRQQRNAINAEPIGGGEIDSSCLERYIGGGGNGEGLCEHGRILRDLLQLGIVPT
jgi:hypothetical protein